MVFKLLASALAAFVLSACATNSGLYDPRTGYYNPNIPNLYDRPDSPGGIYDPPGAATCTGIGGSVHQRSCGDGHG